MDITQITTADVLTVTGASIIVSLLVGALLKALGWTDESGGGALKDRFGALLALGVGVVTVGGFALAQSADLTNAVLVGLLAGGGSQAVHDTVGVVQKAVKSE